MSICKGHIFHSDLYIPCYKEFKCSSTNAFENGANDECCVVLLIFS